MLIAARNGWLCLIMVALLTGCLWHRPGSHAGALASMQRMDVAAPADTGLSAQWFGVSTLLIKDRETSIMIDGFFSRPDWRKTLFSRIGPDAEVIRTALDAGGITRVDALFVAHSHYDHALDAPFVAREKQAILFGSESTLNIARAAGMTGERLRPVEHGDRVRIGKFEVEVYRTPHSPTVFTGAIDESFEGRGRFYDYKMGANHSFLLRHPEGSVLVVPSAGSRPDMLEGARADVVFLAIGTLGKQQRGEIGAYWEQAVVKTGAQLVIPVHWDDFTRPFAEPLRPFPWPFDRVDHALRTLADLANSPCARPVQLRLMPLNTPVSLTRVSRQALAPVGGCAGAPAP